MDGRETIVDNDPVAIGKGCGVSGVHGGGAMAAVETASMESWLMVRYAVGGGGASDACALGGDCGLRGPGIADTFGLPDSVSNMAEFGL